MRMQTNLEIKKYLEENGITQIFISRKTGIDASKLSLALNGERKLTFDEYSLICGVLGVNTDKFLKPRLPEKGEQRMLKKEIANKKKRNLLKRFREKDEMITINYLEDTNRQKDSQIQKLIFEQ